MNYRGNHDCTHAIKFITIKNFKVCSKATLQTSINIERQCSAHLFMFSVHIEASSHIHSINKLQFFKVTRTYSFAVDGILFLQGN